MTDIEDPDLVPNLTAVLGSGDAVSQMRGLAGHEIRPVSAAVVIGLGGTGIQTMSRLRAAIQAGRIDQHAWDAIAFVGVDAVGPDGQKPPLPPGVSEGLAGDMISLQGFNPAAYLKGQKPNDPFLREWWDDGYKVPSSPLNEGLKRERMLGRLAFHKDTTRIRQRIETAMAKAAKVRPEFVAGGDPGNAGGEIPIYLISSSAGGTGSSGFLEVLMAVHLAAANLSLTPKVRAFVLMPGVFAGAVAKQQLGDTAAEAQRANSYGFFKELDHFLVHPEQLPVMMGYDERGGIDKDTDLIHQVYLLDANLGQRGMLSQITDVYEIIAEATFQFLFSEMGRAILGVDGVNIERALTHLDKFDKPRRYCSLGISRVVFPGDTFRRHLVMWWVDWVGRKAFLKEPATTEIIELPDSEQVGRLTETVDKLVQSSVTAQYDDLVRSFLDLGRDAPRALEVRHDVSEAEELFASLQREQSMVGTEVRRTLEVLRPRLVDDLEKSVEGEVFADAASVPMGREIVKHVEKSARDKLARATDGLNMQIARKASSFQKVEGRLEVMAEAANRNVLEQVAAAVAGMFDDETLTVREAAESVGNAIKDWTQAVYEAELAQARHDFLFAACRRLERLRQELERAQARLVALVERAKVSWERDDLLGKDAGPQATTVLVPEDSQPEIEWSALSRTMRKDIEAEHASRLSGDELREFLERWAADSLTRGFFDFGSSDAVTARRAESTLLASLEREARSYALETFDDDGNRVARLPKNLLAAAESLGESERLVTSVMGLEKLSQNVCWSWEPGNFHLPDTDQKRKADLAPRVTTAIAVHPSLADLVDVSFSESIGRTESPDPERLLALSCEWAVPIHCLPVVSSWKNDYEVLAQRRKRERQKALPGGIEPPSHIDKRFENFVDLVPDYVIPATAAVPFAQALLIAAALNSDATKGTVEGLFLRDATNPPIGPVRQVRGVGFVARVVTIDEGRLVPAPESTDRTLGKSWYDALRGIGLDTDLTNVIGSCWDVVLRAVETKSLIRLIDDIVELKIERGATRRRGVDANELMTYANLKNAFEDLRDDLTDFD